MRASVAVKSILSGPEQQLYGRLVRAFPGHVILAQGVLPRFLIGDQASGASLDSSPDRPAALVADFVICRPDFTAVAVVELTAAAASCGARSDRRPQQDELLRASGIKVLRIDAGDIPNEQALKALIAALPVQVPAPPIRRVS